MKNKYCLITGASGLIGEGLARGFSEAGFFVFLVDINEPKYNLEGESLFIKTDVSSEEQVSQLSRQVKSLDVLINNAGIADPENSDPTEMSLEHWNKVIGTNLTGYFLMVKHLLPQLRESSTASIINVASTRGLMSEPHNEAYASSKGGIIALTHSLANSFGPQVRVNAISPGWIAAEGADLKASDHKQHPVGRVGRPVDIAQTALYLASSGADFVTGTNLVVDGGMTHKMIYN